MLAFVNGFQVWDIEDPDNTFELLSKREGAIKLLKVIAFTFTNNLTKTNLRKLTVVFFLSSLCKHRSTPQRKAVSLISIPCLR